MKTKNKIRKTGNIRFLMFIPVIAIALFVFSSCGGKGSGDTTFNAIAPPPPPPPPAPDSVYTNVDEFPVFAGGDSALLGFIRRNTIYPADAKNNNITGKVIVKFVVGKDGSVTDVGIVKGVSPSLDAEAVRVVSTLPKFDKPALKNGILVAVNYVIPISFNLN